MSQPVEICPECGTPRVSPLWGTCSCGYLFPTPITPKPIETPLISLTTTANSLMGYEITRELGIVRGIIVRSRSVFGNIGASFQALLGGNITLYTELCEHARADGFRLMLEHAAERGANAVIAVRFDATEISPGITEVLCYGTAVVVRPLESPR